MPQHSFSNEQSSNLNTPYKEAVDISRDFWTGTFDVPGLRCRAQNRADGSCGDRLEETSSCALCNTVLMYSWRTLGAVTWHKGWTRSWSMTCKRENDEKWKQVWRTIESIFLKKRVSGRVTSWIKRKKKKKLASPNWSTERLMYLKCFFF